jgi:hypothetical protein
VTRLRIEESQIGRLRWRFYLGISSSWFLPLFFIALDDRAWMALPPVIAAIGAQAPLNSLLSATGDLYANSRDPTWWVLTQRAFHEQMAQRLQTSAALTRLLYLVPLTLCAVGIAAIPILSALQAVHIL